MENTVQIWRKRDRLCGLVVRVPGKEKVAAPVQETENTAVGIRHADHVAPSICKKLALTSPTRGGSSVGIVCSQTKPTELLYYTNHPTL
jgi:hypothetical protein